MIKKFMSWLNENKYLFEQLGFSDFEFDHISPENGEVGSVIITFGNDNYICQFTIKNNGVNDIEVLSSETEETVFILYSQVTDKVNYTNFMSIFFDHFTDDPIKEKEENITAFLKWAEKNAHRFKSYGFRNFTTKKSADEGGKISSVNAGTENDRYICNFKIGNDGCSNIEIGSKEKTTLPFWIHGMFTKAVNYDNFMSNFFDVFN